jgi:radical SAM protein with 4Fe4S-binding SPASM domain
MNVEKPRLVAFEITRRCRYNCKHCRANAGYSNNEQDLTTERCKKIIASVAQFSKPICILTGGEPMERSDIYEIIGHGRKQGLQMAMASCGYLFDEKAAVKLKKAGISALSFSLDGATAETHDRFRQTGGAYDLVIKAAKTAKQAGIRFQINTTVSKINIGEINAIAALAEKLGAYCFDAFILVPTGRGQKLTAEILEPTEYEKLLRQLLELKLKSPIEIRVTCGPQFSRVCKQIKTKQPAVTAGGCMAGRGFGFISYRGDVQTCGFLDVSAGNLIKNGFDFGKIWIESEFLKKIRSVSEYKGNCGVCEFGGCCGGCRARAYTMSGDWLAADPVCSYQPKKKICI